MVKIFLILATLLLNTGGCLAITPLPPEDHNKDRYAPGELIVKFKAGVIEFPKDKESIDAGELICHSESIKALNKSYGLIKIERVVKGKLRGKGEDTFSNIYRFIFLGSDTMDMEIIAREYSKQPEVIYAEPNYISTIQPSADE